MKLRPQWLHTKCGCLWFNWCRRRCSRRTNILPQWQPWRCDGFDELPDDRPLDEPADSLIRGSVATAGVTSRSPPLEEPASVRVAGGQRRNSAARLRRELRHTWRRPGARHDLGVPSPGRHDLLDVPFPRERDQNESAGGGEVRCWDGLIRMVGRIGRWGDWGQWLQIEGAAEDDRGRLTGRRRVG